MKNNDLVTYKSISKAQEVEVAQDHDGSDYVFIRPKGTKGSGIQTRKDYITKN